MNPAVPLTPILPLMLSVAWFASQRLAWQGFYLGLLPVALVILATGLRTLDRALLRSSTRSFAIGLAAGAIMSLATRLAFPFVVTFAPFLGEAVGELYVLSRVTRPTIELSAFVAILLAEELLWRGLLFEPLRSRLGPRGAILLSSLVYALAQGGTGSAVVVAIAFACGVVWSALREHTGGLVAPLVCHAVWTTMTVLLFPLV